MATSTSNLHFTRIDIPADDRVALVERLNQTLAIMTDLRSQVKFAHWNVKGMNFIALHELFDEMAAELNEAIDNIAERATTLGGTAMGTVRMAANNSSLSEYPEGTNQCEQVVKVLADQYAAVAEQLRNSIEVASKHNDADTEDLFTEVSRQVDLRLWFLEAHLQ